MTELADLIDDLGDEHVSLATVLDAVSPSELDRPTASPGWTAADQVAHLAYFDDAARLAIVAPDEFVALRNALLPQLDRADELTLRRDLPAADLVGLWREKSSVLLSAARGMPDEKARLEWFGPPMSAKSFITARLMETWTHGQDVVDALGVTRAPTVRLRHIVRLGIVTRGWSFVNRGMAPPAGDVALNLTGPSGEPWCSGSDEVGRIDGPAVDFCLVVTQRRHVDDTDLVVSDGPAREWMLHAQAFAGPATTGPPPRRGSQH
jgi:uncharacterized protein (TIGR03084 family)